MRWEGSHSFASRMISGGRAHTLPKSRLFHDEGCESRVRRLVPSALDGSGKEKIVIRMWVHLSSTNTVHGSVPRSQERIERPGSVSSVDMRVR